MDPALLKSRKSFLDRAAAQPTITKKAPSQDDKTKVASTSQQPQSKKAKIAANGIKGQGDVKTGTTPSMSVNFGILAKIIDHMKKRHLEQSTWGLTLDEILEEISLFDISHKSRVWLLEVLPQNPRIQTDDEGKFVYRPPYRLGSKNPKHGLIRVLKKQDMDGKGGILLSDLADSISQPEKLVQKVGDAVIVIPTQINKRKDKVLYYNDKESEVNVDEEFKQLWRGVAVDHLDEKKIEDYLHKHGIESMKDLAPKKATMSAPKRKAVRRKPLQNEHLAEGILKDYST